MGFCGLDSFDGEGRCEAMMPSRLRSHRAKQLSCSLECEGYVFLESGAGELVCSGSLQIPEKARGSEFGGEASFADVGEAVAVAVGAVGVRVPGEVGSEAVGRRETGALPDKDKAEGGAEGRSDGVCDGDAGLLNEGEGGKGPVGSDELREKVREERDGVALDGECGEAVGDDDGEIAGCGVEERSRFGVEGSAEVGVAEVGGAVGGVGLELEDGNVGIAEDRELRVEALREAGEMERGVDGITGLSMSQLEGEELRGDDAMACGGERDAGGSVIAEVVARIGNEMGHFCECQR